MGVHGPLEARLIALADQLAATDPTAFAAIAVDARAQLGATFQLAVVGRVKAGKSTLVNALIGRRVASTSEAECTRVVTRYEYGPEVGVGDVVLTDGTRHSIDLIDGGLPEELPWSPSAIDHAVVRLQAHALENFTLIDTPGLETTTDDNVAATRAFVLGSSAAHRVDALVYVFRDTQFADDVSFLGEFAAQEGVTSAAVGVLSHADQFGDAWRDDSLGLAARYAEDLSARGAGGVATVIAVAAKMAEAGNTGRVTEHVARSLAALTTIDDIALRFGDVPGGRVTLDALQDVVGIHGLRHGRTIASGGAPPLRDWLVAQSGVRSLMSALQRRYIGRFAQARSAAVFSALHEAARTSPRPLPHLQVLSDAEAEAVMHPLRELAAWGRLTDRSTPPRIRMELDRQLSNRLDARRVGLPAGSSSDEVVARARALEREAQESRATAADVVVREAAATLARSYRLVAARMADSAELR